jgi:hypothetical protein
MESSELPAAAAAASRRVTLPSGGDDSTCRAPLRRLSRQVSFPRLSILSLPLVVLGFVLGFVLPHQMQQDLLPASFLGQANQMD